MAYPQELRAEIVQLARDGRVVAELSDTYGPSVTSINRWVEDADREAKEAIRKAGEKARAENGEHMVSGTVIGKIGEEAAHSERIDPLVTMGIFNGPDKVLRTKIYEIMRVYVDRFGNGEINLGAVERAINSLRPLERDL